MAGYGGTTSNSPVTIGTGTKSFVVNNVGDYIVGSRVRVVNSITNYMDGIITQIIGNNITIAVSNAVGLGSFNVWSFSIVGEQGASGAPGARGIDGARGFTGSAGPSGPTGPAGRVGATGPIGLQGTPGLAGPRGPTGATGLTGRQGATGATGAVGFAGSRGASGSTGPSGPSGPIGFTGSQGATGATGVGTPGYTGSSSPLIWGDYFNGTSYINATSSAYSLIDQQGLASLDRFTIEAYVYPTRYPNPVSGISTIAATYDGSDGWEISIGGTANSFTNIVFNTYKSGSPAFQISGSVNLDKNSWYHIAVVKKKASFVDYSILVDGIEIATQRIPAVTTWGSVNTLYIGKRNDGNNNSFFTGYISNFRITADQTLYNAGYTVPEIPLQATANTKLLISSSLSFDDASNLNTNVNYNNVAKSVIAGLSAIPNGYTGSEGYTGSAGAAADQGYTGSQGDIGYTGSEGIGFAGSRGDIGYTGSAGAGFTGSRGVTGLNGLDGATGPTGPAGPIGYTGSAGDNSVLNFGNSTTTSTVAIGSDVLQFTGSANGVRVAVRGTEVNFNLENTITAKVIETVTFSGNISTNNNVTPNYANSSVQTYNVNGNFSLQPPINMPIGATLTLVFTQGTTARTMTANSQYKFASNVRALTNTARAVDMVNIFKLADNTYLAAITNRYT